VDAISIDSRTGAVLIDESECTACGDCVTHCPFNTNGRVIFVIAERGTAIKCDLCGGEPQCVEICPTDALTFTH